MTKWFERARCKFAKTADQPTAVAANRNPTAVTAATERPDSENLSKSIGSNGSTAASGFKEIRAAAQILERKKPRLPLDVVEVDPDAPFPEW